MGCLATWRSFLRKAKKMPALKSEFEAKSEEEQRQWFCDQRRNEELRNKKRNFGQVQATQTQELAAGTARKERDIGKTFDMFLSEELAKGRTLAEAKSDWQECLTNGMYEVEKVRGEDIVYFFGGVIRDKIDSEMTRAEVKRSSLVETSDDLHKATSENTALVKKVGQHLDSVAIAPVVHPHAPQIPSTMVNSALRSKAPDTMANNFERQLIQAAQEEAEHEEELLRQAISAAEATDDTEKKDKTKRRKTVTYEKLEAKDKIRSYLTKVEKQAEECSSEIKEGLEWTTGNQAMVADDCVSTADWKALHVPFSFFWGGPSPGLPPDIDIEGHRGPTQQEQDFD